MNHQAINLTEKESTAALSSSKEQKTNKVKSSKSEKRDIWSRLSSFRQFSMFNLALDLAILYGVSMLADVFGKMLLSEITMSVLS